MTKTIENLKAAITGESTASATYAAYAAKAAQEGQPLIQKLFEAASKAESVHAANHNKVLEKLGATMEPIDIQIHVGTTAENLKAAIAGETHEFESMYPEFIAVAEEEGQKAAVRSFTWATEAEKEHADFYSVALKALESGDTSSLPRQYWICLVCGDTFKSLEGVDACPLCGTKAEKFLVIKCRMAGLHPSAVVIVATVRALKYNGGVAKADLNNENLEALEKGLPNLLKHVSNIKNVYKLPCVVAINAFPTDTKAELDLVESKCKELGVNVALSEVWAKGGEGGIKLAEEVLRLVEEPNDFTYSYELEGSIEDKLNQIVQKIYGGKRVVLTANAQKQAKQLEALGFGNCPICVAKTQYSLTDDQTKLGAPTDFEVTVRNLKISAGAGFIVALTGEIMTMPGLPKVPAAERIDVDETGKITGLF